MDMKEYAGTKFVKTADVRGGPSRERIAGIVNGKYNKPDAIFESGGRLSLNATNVRALMRVYGRDSEDWIGQEIELFLGETEVNGEKQEMVAVRPISPPVVNDGKAEFNDEVSSLFK
jgi:hypothetical protein